MSDPLEGEATALAPKPAAPQHRPRPLPLFLKILEEQTANDPRRAAKALAGLRAYQQARREDRPPLMPAVGERYGATLRDYGGDGPPLVFVPSLINPPSVVDLTPDNSLLRWLAERGHHVLLLDWGWDVAARRHLSVAGHVEEIVLPFLSGLPRPPALAGYCLGGTIAVAAAAAADVRALVTIAAPWHFSAYPPDARGTLGSLWQAARPLVASLGVLPMEALQSAFWSLDPARTIAKFETLADMELDGEEARGFVALEDWANDGPPLPAAAAEELFVSFLEADLPGSGTWRVAGSVVDPRALDIPFLNILSTVDRIVPQGTATAAGQRLELARGHVGMVIGSRARNELWDPLHAWLSQPRASC